MSLTFYDKRGKPIAYTEDLENIYLFDGSPVAYFDDESVYSYSGKHLGRVESGWILDNAGKHVFFSEEATGGPIHPIKQIKPIKGIKKIRPIKGIKKIKPIKPIKQLGWSEFSGVQFFR